MSNKSKMDELERIAEIMEGSAGGAHEYLFDVSRKREAWEGFCKANGGTLKVIKTVDKTRLRLRAVVPFGESEVVFTESDNMPLKLSYAIHRDDGFRFSLWPQDFTDAVAHFFGAQDIEIGDKAFDKAYVIKATSENRVRRLLEPPGVRKFILAGRYPFLGIDELEDSLQLRMTVNRITETDAQLDALYKFFCQLIELLGV